jgi:hypothetical protein
VAHLNEWKMVVLVSRLDEVEEVVHQRGMDFVESVQSSNSGTQIQHSRL